MKGGPEAKNPNELLPYLVALNAYIISFVKGWTLRRCGKVTRHQKLDTRVSIETPIPHHTNPTSFTHDPGQSDSPVTTGQVSLAKWNFQTKYGPRNRLLQQTFNRRLNFQTLTIFTR